MAVDSNPHRFTKKQQAEIERLLEEKTTSLRKELVEVNSKPHHINELATVWRKSKEHYQAQVFRFLGIFGTILGQQLFTDFMSNKPLFEGLGSPRALATYLAGFAFLAWKQYRPSLNPKQADSAPGVTIVPAQVGAETTPEVVVGVEEVDAEGGDAP